LESIEAGLKQRVLARLRVASEKEITGIMLATESAVVMRKKVYETPKFKMDALGHASKHEWQKS
jgi:hypothetical protein